jgi:hypothetical protein
VYAVIGLAAGITAGWRYAVAAVLAAVIPLTALALLLAMNRLKTVLPVDDEEADEVRDEGELLEPLKPTS